MNLQLNSLSRNLALQAASQSQQLRIDVREEDSTTVMDFGVNAVGGIAAGLLLARICLADLATVRLLPPSPESRLPSVFVQTDHPVAACLASQYAGWKIASDDFFAMGSGPMRAIARTEDLFRDLTTDEDGSCCVGVLEAGSLPTKSAVEFVRTTVGQSVPLTLIAAPTASTAGTIQVVARSVETAMHKLHDLKFPLAAVVSGTGMAPLPPVAGNDLTGIGRTNDAILYGSTVNLWVRCSDAEIEEIGPRVPSDSSAAHGKPFLTLFQEANQDFYALDPTLFSPALVIFHNLETGNSFQFGQHLTKLLAGSFGLN